jgi:sulfide:quinone oxidoreductase
VAPLEFAFLADAYFAQRGLRNKVEIVYATPLPGAFTKPKASAMLGSTIQKRNILLEADFNIMEVDGSKKVIRSFDEREIPYDLLVTVPVNKGAGFIESSGLGDELNYVRTDKYTLQAQGHENIFVMGDATNIPASKAGSVVHFQMDVMYENLMARIEGKPLPEKFDGHSLCYIETGYNKAIMIDFSYDVEPLPGYYPLAGVGPFSLLRESWINHMGKMSFYYMYWDLMLQGINVPLPSKFSMAGKQA